MRIDTTLRGTDEPQQQAERGGPIRTIGDVLSELLASYRLRFPEMRWVVVEEPPESRSLAV